MAERSIREEVEASLDGIEDAVEDVDDVAAPEGDEASAVDEPVEEGDGASETKRERGPDGKFKARGDEQGGSSNRVATSHGANEQDLRGKGDGGKPPEGGVRPPPGFSVAAKQAWDSLPESVKIDIAKREGEMDAGLKRYTGLGRYAEEAERNGTSLQAAVTDYVAVESALRQDFLGGIEFICRRMGVDPRRIAAGLGEKYGAQAATNGNGAAQPQPQQFDPNAIAQHAVSVVRQEIEHRELSAQVDAFKADPKNQFFENVRQDMITLAQSGRAATVQEAYEAACWLNPEIRQILINGSRQTNAGQKRANAARSAAKAVGGAPSTGYAEEPAKPSNKSIHDEVLAAVNSQLGS